MASLFAKMRSSNGASSQSPNLKKDPNAVPPTPLERLLSDAGPIRSDGSDKFWGLENFGNTCYCNSVLQSLYYSVPFREQVINYPIRSPLETITTTPNGLPRHETHDSQASPLQASSTPLKPKTPTIGTSARNPGGSMQVAKPEDKESPEAKKKAAIALGPSVSMNYENTTAYGMPETLFTAMKDIFEAILAHQSRIGVLSPHKFLEVLRRENEMFRTSMHQDAHEFLNLLLNEVIANVEANTKKTQAESSMNGHANPGDFTKALASSRSQMNSGSTSSDSGWVHDLFEGTLTSETKCLTCENVSQRDEAFLDLSVDLNHHSSVTSCLRNFSEEEMLCERNKFHCDVCGGLQEAEKRMKIKRLPKILALHLKRFKFMEDQQKLQKLFHKVVYPYHLRLFNTTDDAEDPDRLYELYAVIVHIGGGPYHGHYVSVIKTQDRGWLLFDDESVEPVNKDYVRNFFGDASKLACAYVLFYQHTTVEAVRREQEAESRAAAAKEAAAFREAALLKESTGLGIKTNGVFMNGLNHVKSAVSPTAVSPVVEDEDRWDSLDRAVTEPPSLPIHPAAEPSPLQSIGSPLSPSKGDAQSKKERKAAEKEKDKAEKARLKALDLKKKEEEKKLAADAKATAEASKVLKQDENQKPVADLNAKEGGLAGSLSRFRTGSKSIGKRPKLWGLVKDGNKDESALDLDESTPPTSLPEKAEKSKNPFGTLNLRKKKSNMLM